MSRITQFLKSYSLGDFISFGACVLAAVAICLWLGGLRSTKEPEPPTVDHIVSSEVITVLMDGDTVSIDMVQYLTGVLAVEMGPDFSEEALKAQAVAAYSYAKYKVINSPGSHKGGADVCNSPSHCQGCMSELTYYSKQGDDLSEQAAAKANWEYMENCVQQVLGYSVEYQGQVINAMYHDSSPYSTVSFESVFGYDVPYLQAVSSPDLIGFEPRKQMYIFSTDELASAVSATGAQNITLTTDTATGRVSSISISDTTMSGVDFRNKTGIRSTCFSLSCSGGNIYIYTLGWGHGIGLCQRGAEVMARQGSTWQDILLHYYSGVTIAEPESN